MTDTLIAPAPPRRRLGSSDIEVSAMAWGMWRFVGQEQPQARANVEAALAASITLFDTADIYGPPFGAAETLFGKILADSPHLRPQMVISTKGGIRHGVPYDSSADYLADAINGSLQRLGIEQIDLWQIHRPDILTHPDEIARALNDARDAGKIRAVGLSNFTVAHTNALRRHLPMPIVSHQPEFSPLALDPLSDGILDQAIEEDMAILAWSPLGGGRIVAPKTEREKAVAAALDAKARDSGISRTVAAYSWILAHPARPIPIMGTQDVDRITEGATALSVGWSRTEWYAVLQASTGATLP